MEEILSKLKFTFKNRTLQISGNYKAKSDLRDELCKLLNIQDSSKIDSIEFVSIIPKTPFYNRVIHFLSLCLDVPKEDPDPESIIEFHADWIRKDLKPPSIENFNQYQFEIPFYCAAFLIDIFCSNQPNEFRFQYSKHFLMQKTVLNLNLIAPLPIAFKYIPSSQNVQLSFADTPNIDARKISEQMRLALNLFNTVKQFSIRFEKVCADNYNSDFFEKLANELDCALLANFLGKDPTTGLITFDMLILPSHPGKEYRENLISKFKDKFNKYFFAKRCDKCNRFFTEIGSSNDECGVFEHEGNQIPFDDGKMEHVEEMEDGSTITLVRYECCGEVAKGSQPQEFMKFGDIHYPETPQKVYSIFTSQTI